MPILRIFILLIVFAPSLLAGIEFEFIQVDLKASPGDKKLVAEFPFTITGERTVKITRVRTSCGCTTAKLDKMTYAPGESGVITTTFKIGDRVGKQIKGIKVETDDPEHPKIKLILRTMIQETVDLSRSILIWKKSDPAEPKSVTLKVVADEPLNLVSVTSTPAFKTELHTVAEGREYRVTVTPTAVSERARAEIRVIADSPEASPMSFRIRAMVK